VRALPRLAGTRDLTTRGTMDERRAFERLTDRSTRGAREYFAPGRVGLRPRRKGGTWP
jgi:hypothetical protein